MTEQTAKWNFLSVWIEFFYAHYPWDTVKCLEEVMFSKLRQTRPRFKSLFSIFNLGHLEKLFNFMILTFLTFKVG